MKKGSSAGDVVLGGNLQQGANPHRAPIWYKTSKMAIFGQHDALGHFRPDTEWWVHPGYPAWQAPICQLSLDDVVGELCREDVALEIPPLSASQHWWQEFQNQLPELLAYHVVLPLGHSLSGYFFPSAMVPDWRHQNCSPSQLCHLLLSNCEDFACRPQSWMEFFTLGGN